MDLNSFLFPAPQSSYTLSGSIGDLLFIPRKKKGQLSDTVRQEQSTYEAMTSAIPCLFMPNASGSSKLMIYFHGNAEDVGYASDLLDYIRTLLKVHVIAVEYPGYGIYDGYPNADQIIDDALDVYDHLTSTLENPEWAIDEEDIILFGRSIGSGPATHVASIRNPCSLLLMSPFTSIRDIVKEQAGSMLQYVISDRFRNIDAIKDVRCPTFLVHGQRDTLISFRHSQELHFGCGGLSSILLPKEMDHNEFDFIDDLIQPYHSFLNQCKISLTPSSSQPKENELPQRQRKPFKSGQIGFKPPRKRELYANPEILQQDISANETLSVIVETQKIEEEEEEKKEEEGETQGNYRIDGIIRFPESLYTPPLDFPQENTNINLWNWILKKFM